MLMVEKGDGGCVAFLLARSLVSENVRRAGKYHCHQPPQWLPDRNGGVKHL